VSDVVVGALCLVGSGVVCNRHEECTGDSSGAQR
jgi:hypothetical protein